MEKHLRVRTPPLEHIRALLSSDEKGGKSDGRAVSRKRWKRVWLIDQLGSHRYNYLARWVLSKENQKSKGLKLAPLSRCLLLCWGVRMRHWMRLLKEAGIRCHEADARSLEPLDKWAIRPVPLEESQVVVLTY